MKLPTAKSILTTALVAIDTDNRPPLQNNDRYGYDASAAQTVNYRNLLGADNSRQ